MKLTKTNRKIALGGTFDRLHLGHKKLLEQAFSLGNKVVLGLSSDSFINEKLWKDLILPYQKRKQELFDYVKKQYPSKKLEILELNDVYGPTLEDSEIETLVVSEETIGGAKLINKVRKDRALSPLKIEVVPLVIDDCGKKLDSGRIRSGVVSREGKVFRKLFENDVSVSSSQKKALRSPMGRFFEQIDERCRETVQKASRVGIVGDLSLEAFLENELRFDFAVADRKTRRKVTHEIPDLNMKVLCAINEPGRVLAGAAVSLKLLVEEGGGLLQIEGEEDLMVLPMIMNLPLNSVIYYGQPNEGMVELWVDEDCKQRWYKFLKE